MKELGIHAKFVLNSLGPSDAERVYTHKYLDAQLDRFMKFGLPSFRAEFLAFEATW